jgi:hypothetical protein
MLLLCLSIRYHACPNDAYRGAIGKLSGSDQCRYIIQASTGHATPVLSRTSDHPCVSVISLALLCRLGCVRGPGSVGGPGGLPGARYTGRVCRTRRIQRSQALRCGQPCWRCSVGRDCRWHCGPGGRSRLGRRGGRCLCGRSRRRCRLGRRGFGGLGCRCCGR